MIGMSENSGAQIVLFIYLWVTMTMVAILFGNFLSGKPPEHCQYLVKTNKPGVYSCSQYSKIKTIKK